jgi:hypothetical protein
VAKAATQAACSPCHTEKHKRGAIIGRLRGLIVKRTSMLQEIEAFSLPYTLELV